MTSWYMFIIRKVRLKKMKWTHADMEMDIDSDMNKDIGKNRNFIPGSCSSKMMLLHEIILWKCTHKDFIYSKKLICTLCKWYVYGNVDLAFFDSDETSDPSGNESGTCWKLLVIFNTTWLYFSVWNLYLVLIFFFTFRS